MLLEWNEGLEKSVLKVAQAAKAAIFQLKLKNMGVVHMSWAGSGR